MPGKLDQVEDSRPNERFVAHLGLLAADGKPCDRLPECPWAGRLTRVESGGEAGLHGYPKSLIAQPSLGSSRGPNTASV